MQKLNTVTLNARVAIFGTVQRASANNNYFLLHQCNSPLISGPRQLHIISYMAEIYRAINL